MNETIFAQLETALNDSGPDAVLSVLASHLESESRFHELFEVLKMQVRRQLDLPLLSADTTESLSAEQRERLENGLLDVCRRVGLMMLSAGRFRDSWQYLRVVGDTTVVQRALAEQEPTEENLDEFLELCIHERLGLARGFEIMLKNYGTCNSITTFESSMYGQPRADRAVAASLLVQHVYDELCENIRAHVQRHENSTPDPQASLAELIQDRPWLFSDGGYHIDATHLSSVVGCARDLDDPTRLRQAIEMAEYGQRLAEHLQYDGEPPFRPLYPTSLRYFHTLLGQDVDEHLAFFKQQAEACDPREETTLAIETYIDLLARVGRHETAIAESLRLLPDDIQQTGRAPSLLELAQATGNFQAVQDVSRRRQDALGYAIGLLGPPAAD